MVDPFLVQHIGKGPPFMEQAAGPPVAVSSALLLLQEFGAILLVSIPHREAHIRHLGADPLHGIRGVHFLLKANIGLMGLFRMNDSR